jgi:hypothetical protein
VAVHQDAGTQINTARTLALEGTIKYDYCAN